MDDSIPRSILLIFLIVAGGFFAGAETAFSYCNTVRIRLLAEDGDLADWAATFGNLVTCNSFLSCFTELGGGSVDAVFVDKPVAVSYAAQNAGFKIIDENLGAEQYGIAFRSGDAELCSQIEGAVEKLVENGTYAEIAAKYPDINPNALLFLN